VNKILNADLHCHSVVSDGTLTPEALVQRAKANGVELWALTDHDEVSGIERASIAAHAAGLHYLSGVEISVSFLDKTVHIVGLGFDHFNQDLKDGLKRTRGGRSERAKEMAAGLAKVGIRGAFEGAMSFAGNPDLISRSHFARFLVETGVCKDPNEVFRKYLTEGKPGFVPHTWATLKEAVSWITGAGGVAVIAHPARYKFTPNEEYALFTEFKNYGGQGVEVITGSHTPAEYISYAETAVEFGLVASRGSDFHSPNESHTELGTLPFLPKSLTPVWEILIDRIKPSPTASVQIDTNATKHH